MWNLNLLEAEFIILIAVHNSRVSWKSEAALGAREIGVPKEPVRPQLSPTTIHFPHFSRENEDQKGR